MKTIVGHLDQLEQLSKAVSSKRVPNAYLFSGPKGVGKRLVSERFMQMVSCLSPNEKNEPCFQCRGCKKTVDRNHPDQFIVEPDGEKIKIGQIRALQSQLQFHPLESSRKVAIIDDADRMNEAAANSLLKILEEPPELTHFILITSLPNALLPTIRSRCQHLPFNPLNDEELANYLSLNEGIPTKEAMRIARFSGGSMGVAISIDTQFVDDILGRFTTIMHKASTADIIETSQIWANEDPDRIRLLLDLLMSWYRDLLRFQTTGNASASIHPEAIKLASHIVPSRMDKAISEIAHARFSLEANANKQLMFENLLFSLTQ